jgi:putative transposase
MNQHTEEFSITAMSNALNVARSGYYRWQHRQWNPSPRQLRREQLDTTVKRLFVVSKGRSGSPNLVRDLLELGIQRSRNTVADSMQRQGLRAKAAKKFKVTTDSKHNLPVAENLLQQNFTAAKPNEKWVSDITYLWTDEGWLYLAIMLDLYSRSIVGWSMSERMTTPLVSDTLKMALWRRKMPKGVLVHSDRGSQYCSRDYQALLAQQKLVCSMSRKGNCWDNAVAESFFHTLKVELIHGERFYTREQCRRAVFEYIEVDYNRKRRHSAIGFISPMAFEAKHA